NAGILPHLDHRERRDDRQGAARLRGGGEGAGPRLNTAPSGWVRMLVLFGVAGFVEIVAYGQVTAFTPLYLPRPGIPESEFAFSRAFQSLGLGNTGLMLATLAEHAPAARTAFAFGVVNGANPLGAFVGPLIGGPIVDRFGFPTLIAADALAVAGVIALLSFG